MIDCILNSLGSRSRVNSVQANRKRGCITSSSMYILAGFYGMKSNVSTFWEESYRTVTIDYVSLFQTFMGMDEIDWARIVCPRL